jgi:hypothetical protein
MFTVSIGLFKKILPAVFSTILRERSQRTLAQGLSSEGLNNLEKKINSQAFEILMECLDKKEIVFISFQRKPLGLNAITG